MHLGIFFSHTKRMGKGRGTLKFLKKILNAVCDLKK
jgi:hypothetical protein